MNAPDSLRQEAMKRAAAARISPEIMEQALLTERRGRPYIVELEDEPGRSFYRCTQEGPSRILYINIAHPFFTGMYAADGTTREFRDALEVFLWVLGTSELDASDKDRLMYERERYLWSRHLGQALPILAKLMEV
jgi:hypothetical protein